MNSDYTSRGYLLEDFRLFHLKDASMTPVDWHYHNFHKIIFFRSGHVRYTIEGKIYNLQPGDLVLVGRGCIHRPEVLDNFPYERIIVYIAPSFLASLSKGCDLETCFRQAQSQYHFVLRPRGEEAPLQALADALQQAEATPGFGQQLLLQSLFIQLMVAINREVLDGQLESVSDCVGDQKIVSVLQYLNLHLTESLSVDFLAAHFYISRYHLMRKFKEATGDTIHSYLNKKRLLLAREQILGGTAVLDACYGCGFQDYSAFSRAYKKQFGISPRRSRQDMPHPTPLQWE